MGDEKLSCDVIFCPEVSGDTYEVSWIYEQGTTNGLVCGLVPMRGTLSISNKQLVTCI